MFRTIYEKLKRDDDYPDRARTIDVYTRVLEGALYDHLPYGFHTERQESRLGDGEYIPLRDRRPSVRFNLCRLVVDDSVSMLFSEGHFPAADCEDEPTKEALAVIVKETALNETMLDAATKGSVGSVAIFFQVLKQPDGTWRPFFSAKRTRFLTPIFDRNSPGRLTGIVEQYKTKGHALRALGYTVKDDALNTDFWFRRDWDDKSETWFLPWKVKDAPETLAQVSEGNPLPMTKDATRSVDHNLGFVPWVWVRNLPGELRLLAEGDGTDLAFSDVDGACTFAGAVDDMIEIEYLLSQAGRGLKYNMDPMLLLKEPVNDKPITKGGSVVTVDENGDGKMIEIEGTAFTVVMDFCKALRELAIEAVHGNRADANKLSGAQSGRAMELMNQALIWLADRLRVTYGERALISLLRMSLQAHAKFPFTLDGKKLPANLNADAKITLRWPRWYPPTEQDRQNRATTLKTHKDAGHMSQETAVKTIAADYDVEDVAAEIVRINSDQERDVALLAKQTQAKGSVSTSI